MIGIRSRPAHRFGARSGLRAPVGRDRCAAGWHRTCDRLAARLRSAGWFSAKGQAGSAVVEFLGVSLLLLVPLVYLVLTLGKVQAAAFAAEGAARDAGRAVVRAATLDEGVARARAAVELAFADQGVAVSGAEALRLRCESDPCLSPGGRVVVETATSVPLPGVPGWLADVVPAEVPVSARFVAVVDEFRQAPS